MNKRWSDSIPRGELTPWRPLEVLVAQLLQEGKTDDKEVEDTLAQMTRKGILEWGEDHNGQDWVRCTSDGYRAWLREEEDAAPWN